MAKTGRTERGRVTRARIVAAARRLFNERGYVDTTMASIASEAGVAVQSLYLSFGSKVGILSACHDLAVVGDDEPIPVLDRPWVSDVGRTPDARAALRIVLANTLPIIERVASIQAVIRDAAADPEVAELRARLNKERYITLAKLAEVVAAKPGFRTDVSPGHAADLLYALNSEDLHQLLVVDRGWEAGQWRNWVADTVAAQLLE